MSSGLNEHPDVSLAKDSAFHYLDISIPECLWDCLSCTLLTLTLFLNFGFTIFFLKKKTHMYVIKEDNFMTFSSLREGEL